jgi:hypothetical protein
MNTFPCHYSFAVFWSIVCFLSGGLVTLFVFSMCKSSGDADRCAECVQRGHERRQEAELETQAMRAASAVISSQSSPSRIALCPEEVLEKEQAAGNSEFNLKP